MDRDTGTAIHTGAEELCDRDGGRHLVTRPAERAAWLIAQGHRRPVLPLDGRHLLRRRREAAGGARRGRVGARRADAARSVHGVPCPRRSRSCRRAGATATSWTALRASGRSSPSPEAGRPSSTTRAVSSAASGCSRLHPAFADAVAEMALALALASSRDIVAEDRARARRARALAEQRRHARHVSPRRKRVGFVGFGNIGRRLRELIEPFGCELRAYDPWLTDAYLRDEGVEPTSLRELLETSRVIFVLATPTTENRALLSRELLELVPPDAVLVLVSRAHVVDFDALTELVLDGRFRAAIDVFPDGAARPAASDPYGAGGGAVAASSRARARGAPGDRAPSRRRPRGDRQRVAAAADAGRRARARDAVRAHDTGCRRVKRSLSHLLLMNDNWFWPPARRVGSRSAVPEMSSGHPYQPSFPEGYRPGIGIVGCGEIVRTAHLPGYRRYGQRVVGVYDVRPEATAGRPRAVRRRDVFGELDELLSHPEIEIVDVATHPDVRPALVRQALAAGKHVLAQKPLAADLRDGPRARRGRRATRTPGRGQPERALGAGVASGDPAHRAGRDRRRRRRHPSLPPQLPLHARHRLRRDRAPRSLRLLGPLVRHHPLLARGEDRHARSGRASTGRRTSRPRARRRGAPGRRSTTRTARMR